MHGTGIHLFYEESFKSKERKNYIYIVVNLWNFYKKNCELNAPSTLVVLELIFIRVSRFVREIYLSDKIQNRNQNDIPKLIRV